MHKTNEVSAKIYLELSRQFEEELVSLLSRQDYEGVTKLVEKYSDVNPQVIELLEGIYDLFLNKLGNLNLAETIAVSLEKSLQKMNYLNSITFKQPVIIPSLDINNIDKLIDLTLVSAYLQNLRIYSTKPILPLGNIFSDRVVPLQNYLAQYFDVVMGDDKILLLKYHNILPLGGHSFASTPNTQFSKLEEFVSNIYPELKENDIDTSIFNLNSDTQDLAYGYLKNHGFNSSNEFIVVQFQAEVLSREPTTVGLSTYLKVIELFVELNYEVVLIGDVLLEWHHCPPTVSNLTGQIYPFEVNLYLAAESKFYVVINGCVSKLAYSFGTPQFLVNSSPFAARWANTFVSCAPLFYEKNGEQLKMSEIKSSGLLSSSWKNLQVLKGIYSVPTSSDDVMRATQEMLDFVESGTIYETNNYLYETKKQFGIFGALCSNTISWL